MRATSPCSLWRCSSASLRDGQVALLQGRRRIGDLARQAILGAIVGVVLTLPIAYFWRQNAAVALLLGASGASLASAWWYARRITVVSGSDEVGRHRGGGSAPAPPRTRLDERRADGCRGGVCGARRDRPLSGLRSGRSLPGGDGALGRLLRVHSGGDGRGLSPETVIGGSRRRRMQPDGQRTS